MVKWSKILLVISAVFLSEMNLAVDLPKRITDHTFAPNIHSVTMFRKGWSLSNPIIELSSDQSLLFSFDDLSNRNRNYYYTIYHCTRNWEISAIPQQEYMQGFTEYPLNDRAYSVNTKIGYVNYLLELPNQDVSLPYSGNYALVVYDADKPTEPVITRRFFVVENKVGIDAQIRRATFDSNRGGEGQEVDVRVDTKGWPIQDSYRDIHLVITQNNRSDNAITNLRPLFVQNGILDYDYNLENVFKGENEFRYFEIRGIKHPGEGVLQVGFDEPCYYSILEQHKIRVQNRYTYYREMNGRYLIEVYDKKNADVEADYVLVHFTLPMDNILLGGGVYVFGALSNWQCQKVNEMKWNMEKNRYELSMLLKQGYYNFTYAWMDQKTKEIKSYILEGSHSDTENDYQVYVYHARLTDRYDRLIGYKTFNSLANRSFAR